MPARIPVIVQTGQSPFQLCIIGPQILHRALQMIQCFLHTVHTGIQPVQTVFQQLYTARPELHSMPQKGDRIIKELLWLEELLINNS